MDFQTSASSGPDVNSLEEFWMPFTDNRGFKTNPHLVTRSEGVYCWDHHGRQIIDGSSGLFCVAAGHGRREIADAVYQQMLQNDYVSPFMTGQPLSFALAQKIASLLPETMNRVFFVNSGSESIDTALKIVMAYHRARGNSQRLRFVSRERAYHGVNIGGISLSGMVRNRETFPVVMPNISLIRHTFDPNQRFVRGQNEQGAELADDLERICQSYGAGTIAAVFVEPVAGSTGVLVPPKGYLERLREICTKYGILLVFDEVICGFGRLGGHHFGADAFGVEPDIITMAKALTNGAVPMGAVGVQNHIYETITNASPENTIEFFHGYTYSGHPIACAAGLAAQEIYQRENLFARAKELSEPFLDRVWSLADHPLVYDIRGFGLMAGVEVIQQDQSPGKRGTSLQKRMFENGLHVKFTGDSAILAPPLISKEAHLDEIIDKFRKTLNEMT